MSAIWSVLYFVKQLLSQTLNHTAVFISDMSYYFPKENNSSNFLPCQYTQSDHKSNQNKEQRRENKRMSAKGYAFILHQTSFLEFLS